MYIVHIKAFCILFTGWGVLFTVAFYCGEGYFLLGGGVLFTGGGVLFTGTFYWGVGYFLLVLFTGGRGTFSLVLFTVGRGTFYCRSFSIFAGFFRRSSKTLKWDVYSLKHECHMTWKCGAGLKLNMRLPLIGRYKGLPLGNLGGKLFLFFIDWSFLVK